MTSDLEPFRVDVDDAVLEDLRARLDRTRLPEELEGAGWDYGIPTSYVAELLEHWRHTYDWRVHEARLNELEQFRTLVDGQSLHFVHARSRDPDARPLLLMHGWPGSIVEFLDVVPRLTEPDADGDARESFHVVAPSLPGYGFSGPTHARGWDVDRIAGALDALMQALGYSGYVAQGGDWGAQVATRIATLEAGGCRAIHLNMALGDPPAAPVALTEAEQADLAAMKRFQREESGYAVEQATRPQTLGVALDDSPAGLLAWIVEKFRAWSDCDGHPENAFTRDQLITNVMVYWVTRTATSSARLYWEHRRAARATPEFVELPTGVARYPKEILRFPRSWVEQRYDVTYWSELPRGGHFAAMEQPELFAADLRAFCRTLA